MSGITTVVYPITDIATAKALYGALLGVEPETDTPYYVGFSVDGQQIGLDAGGHDHGITGPINYWNVEDIEASITQLVDAGATRQQPATDVGGGKLIATVQDADGNVIGLIQP
jgi:predicted enzyme related to lactoylglutathione lyase